MKISIVKIPETRVFSIVKLPEPKPGSIVFCPVGKNQIIPENFPAESKKAYELYNVLNRFLTRCNKLFGQIPNSSIIDGKLSGHNANRIRAYSPPNNASLQVKIFDGETGHVVMSGESTNCAGCVILKDASSGKQWGFIKGV